jgi:hypothetical protein
MPGKARARDWHDIKRAFQPASDKATMPARSASSDDDDLFETPARPIRDTGRTPRVVDTGYALGDAHRQDSTSIGVLHHTFVTSSDLPLFLQARASTRQRSILCGKERARQQGVERKQTACK